MHHTHALILKKDEWSEADWLVTALSRDFGKIRLRVQGARKHGAKLQGHIEPGSISEFSFVLGRNGYRLTTARLVEPLLGLKTSPDKLRALYWVMSFLDGNLMEERDRAAELFGVARQALDAMNRARRLEAVKNILLWSQVKFFEFLGLLPSPRSPEAARCRNLLALGATTLQEVEAIELLTPDFSSEMTWLIGYLKNVVSVPRAVNGPRSAL